MHPELVHEDGPYSLRSSGEGKNTLGFIAFLVILIFALTLGGCSTPTPLDSATAENLNKIASGPADATSKNVQTQPAVAAAYMGDAHAEAVDVQGATVQRTNSASGHLQTGFTFAATMKSLQEAMSDAAKDSPTMQALQAQLNRLLAATPPDEAAISGVIALIKTEEESLRSTLSRAGGDLSHLTNLTQVFTLISANGANDPLTDAQADAIAGTIAPTVVAARGGVVTPAPVSAPAAEDGAGK